MQISYGFQQLSQMEFQSVSRPICSLFNSCYTVIDTADVRKPMELHNNLQFVQIPMKWGDIDWLLFAAYHPEPEVCAGFFYSHK